MRALGPVFPLQLTTCGSHSWAGSCGILRGTHVRFPPATDRGDSACGLCEWGGSEARVLPEPGPPTDSDQPHLLYPARSPAPPVWTQQDPSPQRKTEFKVSSTAGAKDQPRTLMLPACSHAARAESQECDRTEHTAAPSSHTVRLSAYLGPDPGISEKHHLSDQRWPCDKCDTR